MGKGKTSDVRVLDEADRRKGDNLSGGEWRRGTHGVKWLEGDKGWRSWVRGTAVRGC